MDPATELENQYSGSAEEAQEMGYSAENQQEYTDMSASGSRVGMGSRSQTGSGQIQPLTAVSGGNDSKAQMEEHRRKMKERIEQDNATLWQHPFVDVFKHFKVMPGSDWKLNKRQGEVNEYFAREIGRRAIAVEGTISANNFIQTPNPQGTTKALGLTGRYCYLQVKCPRHGLAFSYHLDLGMAERSHGIRISVSNLFKNFGTSNGFVAQIPLELKSNCWTIVVLDLYEILRVSNLLPPTYLIEGSYAIRSVTLCANSHVRGVFTSDNLYDHVTLPADMRFKFAFDLSKWSEYFDWQALPQDWAKRKGQDENMNLPRLVQDQRGAMTKDQQREAMRAEIDELIATGKEVAMEETEMGEDSEMVRRETFQRKLGMQLKQGPGDAPVTGYQLQDDETVERRSRQMSADYRAGMFSGLDAPGRSHKLDKDPILELQHIIGYQADKCTQVKWARCEGENVVIFSTGGALIAMDADTSEQKRFFFGHSSPISCFDVSRLGNMLASAQEGVSKKNDETGKGRPAMIRLWDYASARLLTAIIMPVIEMKQMHFSDDGRYLACVGLDAHNKELIWVWDVAQVPNGEKPQVVTKKTSEFNILDLKFSPLKATRLASCGKENIRLWRISDTKNGMVNIRGSAVVLNHHARDTVFTCLDFEHGMRVADEREAEKYLRLFVGTKHGMVFVVNYQDETIEATYKTNDAAIYSLSVNEAFCVIGSMDSYVRSWPLDFNDFHIEAQHEGIVSSVDISNDGLKIACGTMFGSIGILDKSNQGYKTLLRSHTDEILAVDYHLLKNNLISVSTDRTIRLWDLSTFEEVYEFSSPIDQPISVSAHPNQSIFACGFDSGKMRIFDIESTEVLDEFSQFNKPLASLSYDSMGRYLIACSVDGSVSIHNAARQHLPIKMMQLQHAPEFVHVAFTYPMPGDPDPIRSQRFAVMGENGNNIICYETESFLIQHWVQVGQVVKSFKFSNSNKDLVVVTKDCRVRIYGINRYEGVFLREVTNCHRGLLTALDVTSNSGYFLTGGEDSLIKIWDYEAQQTTSWNYQSFIGHTYGINAVMFNPRNQGQIITVGARDGIYFWDFNGDVDNDYTMPMLAGQDEATIVSEGVHKKSLLQEMRTKGKAPKEFRNQMAEDSFYLTEFSTVDSIRDHKMLAHVNDTMIRPPPKITEARASKGLTYNHYVGESKRCNIEVEGQTSVYFGDMTSQQRTSDLLPQKLINGYDGFGGVHDNLVWDPTGGRTFFTLNNKLVVESIHDERKQQSYARSSVQLSCMAVTSDFSRIAVGEGSTSDQERSKYNQVAGKHSAEEEGNSLIFIWEIDRTTNQSTMQASTTQNTDPGLMCRFSLKFHGKGIQSLSFSQNRRYLASLGVQEDNMIAVWDAENGTILSYTHMQGSAHNMVKMARVMTTDNRLHFSTVGNNAKLTLWSVDLSNESNNELMAKDVLVPEEFSHIHFCSVDYTAYSNDSYNIVVGCSDGSLAIFDPQRDEFKSYPGRNKFHNDEEVGCISINTEGLIVFATSRGHIVQQKIDDNQFLGTRVIETENHNSMTPPLGAVVSLSMDLSNNEGLVGTESGQIWYINFDYDSPVRIVSSCNRSQDAVSLVQMDPSNDQVFIAGGGPRSDDLKMYAHENMDQVHNFPFNLDEDGYVVFMTNCPKPDAPKKGSKSRPGRSLTSKKLKLVGFSNGMIRIANLTNLTWVPNCAHKIPLIYRGEKITAGHYTENNFNFVVGTNFANLYICSLSIKGRNSSMTCCVIENVGKVNKEEGDACNTKYKTHQKNLISTSGGMGMNDDMNFVGLGMNKLVGDGEEIEIDQGSDQIDEDLVGITCITTPATDPIGTLLIGFDDGTVRLWQSQMNKNIKDILVHKKLAKQNLSNVFTKIEEEMQKGRTPNYDISRYGYQQFDKYDEFKLSENPHGDMNYTEGESKDLAQKLYDKTKYPSLFARFPPGQAWQHHYLAIVENFPWVYIREYASQSSPSRFEGNTRKISVSCQPTALNMCEFSKLQINQQALINFKEGQDEEKQKKQKRGSRNSNFLLAVGSKEGKTQIYKLNLQNYSGPFLKQEYCTKGGVAYGAITAIEIQDTAENMICSTESGELLQYKLLDKLNVVEYD